MKAIIIIFGCLVASFQMYSIDYATVGAGGSWGSDAIWSGSGVPDDVTDNADILNNDSVYIISGSYTINFLEFSQNGKLYVAANCTLTVNNISILNNADFYIDGVINIIQDITMAPNSTLDIDLTGSLDVGDDFVGNNNVVITNDGDIDIAGDMYLGNGANLTGSGTVSAATYSGTGTLFGSIIGTLVPGKTYYDAGTSAGILPIELMFFKASTATNGVKVTWTTASEENNHYFTVERSTNGIDFETIGTVLGAGNSSVTLTYTYTDMNPIAGSAYYRLKQTDYNGQFEVFDIIAVNSMEAIDVKVGPNPATNYIDITFGNNEVNAQLVIYNMVGQVVKTAGLQNTTETISLEGLNNGQYVLVLTANGEHQARKLIISK